MTKDQQQTVTLFRFLFFFFNDSLLFTFLLFPCSYFSCSWLAYSFKSLAFFFLPFSASFVLILSLSLSVVFWFETTQNTWACTRLEEYRGLTEKKNEISNKIKWVKRCWIVCNFFCTRFCISEVCNRKRNRSKINDNNIFFFVCFMPGFVALVLIWLMFTPI